MDRTYSVEILFNRLVYKPFRCTISQRGWSTKWGYTWGIVFPFLIFFLWSAAAEVLAEYPSLLIYLTKVSSKAASILVPIDPNYLKRLGNYSLLLLLYIATILIIGLFLKRKYKSSYFEIGLSFYDWRLYLVTGSIIGALKSMLTIVPVIILWPEYVSDYSSRLLSFEFEIWILFVTVPFIAGPIFEEILFRGILFSALRKRFNLIVALTITSVVFSYVIGLEST